MSKKKPAPKKSSTSMPSMPSMPWANPPKGKPMKGKKSKEKC